ncbi:DUF4340 domain-containing protein [Myxococcus sp. K15C18031901]|uniref:DUF4340 domain-containing protein n=1 Tax=Myxococcus dinghuensis TaxID=2906761 RepID=UPI0020A7C599|nr:DUF4340 domain-containing protein [Myxococcus dinghuensis]MCP3103868.1 DUF4340 domain-containing protein [Myxococcus dinghuensis]
MSRARPVLAGLLATTALGATLALSACDSRKKGGPRDAEPQAAAEKLFAAPTPPGAPAPVFTHVTVRAQGDTTELTRGSDGKWTLTAPVKARAEDTAVEAILGTLESSKSSTLVDAAPTDAALAKYGLKPPVFSVTARTSADGPEAPHAVTLHGGVENTFDGSVYVRREGDPRVYAAQGSVRWSLDRGTFSLRAKEFLGGLDVASLTAIDVKTREQAYSLTREPGGKAWRLVKPLAERADEAKVAGLLSDLKDQRALAFLDDSAATRKKLGLETPGVDARFTSTAGEPVRVRLSRAVVDGESRVFALREQGAVVVLGEVPDSALTALDVDTQDLKDKHVLHFRREDVRRVVFQPGNGAPVITVENTNTADAGTAVWEVTTPTPGKALHFRMVALVRALNTLRASAFGEARPRDWSRFGIGETSPLVVLSGAGGRELARLVLGHEVPDGSGERYARGAGDEVVEISVEGLDLPHRPEDLMEAPPTAEPQP